MLNKDRKLPGKCIENQMSVLVLELKHPESKELVVKIRANNDHDAHMKILNSVDVPRVKSILEEFGGRPDGLTKEGICMSILNEIRRRLPHKCGDCNRLVMFHLSVPVFSKCLACGTQLCTNCFQGEYRNVACNPCSGWISERFAIPKEL